MFDPALPFLLTDTCEGALLFARPERVIAAAVPAEVPAAFTAMRAALDGGAHLAGFLAYEAGLALEPRLAGLPAGDGPLLWMGAFGPPRAVDAAALLRDWERPAGVGAATPLATEAGHAAAVARIAALIAAGDIYQANLTFQAAVETHGHPLALHAMLRARARPAHGGLLFTGERWLLSLSPELFFRCDRARLTARPMKGTAARRADPAADAAAAERLRADPKNRAENLMIADLIRNDFSRVATPGTVRVPAAFTLEAHAGVHQMTTTVTAELANGRDALDALRALFPCGSITGAPKIRAMEVIAEVEAGPRGAYCGSLGWIAPRARGGPGDAWFNVLIRTLAVAGGRATVGLGSGVVADSHAADEWRECLAKAGFLTPQRPCTLIETLRVEGGRPLRLDRHLARMADSAARFGFAWDEARVRGMVERAVLPRGGRWHAEGMTDEASPAPPPPSAAPTPPPAGEDGARLRLLLSEDGAVSVQLSPPPPTPAGPVDVAVVPLPVPPDDWRLRHKSGDRAFYDEARRAAGTFEVVFARPDGRLTEGSFTSLFVERGGRLLTPPLTDGLLPGVLRAELLEAGRAIEHPLTAADLAGGFLLGNSLRGLLPARLRSAVPRP